MALPTLFFRVAVKRNLSVSDHLTRRGIPSYCIPVKDRWCTVVYNQDKIKASTILEATGGLGLEIKECSNTKSHLILWQGSRKLFWILIDGERGEATYRPDMVKSLFNHLTSKRSEMQYLREMTIEEVDAKLQEIGKLPPEKACHEFLDFMDIQETEFPPFAEIDTHFENAATKNKQCYWVS